MLSLLIAWSFFHKLYEPDSVLSRNFLIIAPNGCAGRNWRDDFQITLHTRDDVRVVRDTGGVVWIVETKGREELDLPQKMTRLRQWCADATAAEDNGHATTSSSWTRSALKNTFQRLSPRSRQALENTNDRHSSILKIIVNLNTDESVDRRRA